MRQSLVAQQLQRMRQEILREVIESVEAIPNLGRVAKLLVTTTVAGLDRA